MSSSTALVLNNKEIPKLTEKNIDIKYVCYDCVGDQILATAIKETGAAKECSYCGDTRDAVELDDLADRIHQVIENHFERSPDEPDGPSAIMLREGMLDDWEPDGEPVVDLMASIAGVTEGIAKDLTEMLSDRFHYWAMKEGGDNPYNTEAYYEERSPNDLRYRFSWNAFRHEITYRERFFPGNAEPVLDDIFRDLRDLKTYDGTPVIRKISPDDKDFFVWRARTAHSEEELARILKCPENQLGAAPSSSAEAGRMNAKGISVFYGAMEKSTCVSEVRPPVGSYVVLGGVVKMVI